ncbi:dihydrodipicolinate synthase family protein [Streptomyces sp. NPDC088124]|uniref:dihydrodipicolinate synthase family protein n=1 Tax=Streptomyces sp. NPDC088124 TaxID=3154654 RepID=UPI003430DE86
MLDGVLFFPVTPFAPDGALDPQTLDAHVRAGVEAGAVFAACGTGEFRALSPREHTDVVRAAVDAANGAVPVYAGVGGALPTAVDLAVQVVGFEDGVGDIETLARTVVAIRASLRDSAKPFQFFNGLPTTEVTVPAYRAIGAPLYSSSSLLERGLELVRSTSA